MIMRRLTLFSVFLIGCFAWVTPIYAALDLELTQGTSAAIPIAVLPFSGAEPVVAGNTTLPMVIQHDLQNSGQFRVVHVEEALPESAEMVPAIDYAHWRDKGVNALVTGSVRAVGSNRYEVTLRLMNVFSGNVKQGVKNNVLLNQVFTAKAKGLRQLAHQMSDLIYQQLTGAPGVFSTKLAYILVQRSTTHPPRYSLEVADADGFNPQALLTSQQPIMSPAWSPDGSQLAYVSFEGHRASIYLQDLRTGHRHVMSKVSGINGAPAFSPDGKKMALVLTQTGQPKIYILDLATEQLTQITQGWSIDTEPNWAPDGKSLLLTSNRDGTPQLYRYVFATKSITRLTYQGNYNARGSFLPNQSAIVMMHRDSGLFGIAQQDLRSGSLRMLVQTGADESPSVAPNGKMIVYATQYGGRGVLAQVSVDGRIKLRLPAPEGQVQEPAWSGFLH